MATVLNHVFPYYVPIQIILNLDVADVFLVEKYLLLVELLLIMEMMVLDWCLKEMVVAIVEKN
jgi:hypothetical protein